MSELFMLSIRLVRLLAGTRQVVVVVYVLPEELEADDMSEQFETVDEFAILQSALEVQFEVLDESAGQPAEEQFDMQFEVPDESAGQPTLEVQFEVLDESAGQPALEVQFETDDESDVQFDESAEQPALEVQFELQSEELETIDELDIVLLDIAVEFEASAIHAGGGVGTSLGVFALRFRDSSCMAFCANLRRITSYNADWTCRAGGCKHE
jgi:hypothetical protein